MPSGAGDGRLVSVAARAIRIMSLEKCLEFGEARPGPVGRQFTRQSVSHLIGHRVIAHDAKRQDAAWSGKHMSLL